MSDTFDIAGFTSLFMGLFAIAAAIGEWRRPGLWQKMVAEIGASPALQLLTAFAEVALGAVIYLANPWDPPDTLSCLMNAIGGLMVLEGLVIAAFADRWLALVTRMTAPLMRLWVGLAVILGLALIVAAIPRF